jgi:hypothetical protein
MGVRALARENHAFLGCIGAGGLVPGDEAGLLRREQHTRQDRLSHYSPWVCGGGLSVGGLLGLLRDLAGARNGRLLRNAFGGKSRETWL